MTELLSAHILALAVTACDSGGIETPYGVTTRAVLSDTMGQTVTVAVSVPFVFGASGSLRAGFPRALGLAAILLFLIPVTRRGKASA